MSDTLINANIALALGALLIVLSLSALAIANRVRGKTDEPAVDEILTALTPWLYKAIIGGDRAALWGLQQTEAVITGADKAPVAERLNAPLPHGIVRGALPIPVARLKALTPR